MPAAWVAQNDKYNIWEINNLNTLIRFCVRFCHPEIINKNQVVVFSLVLRKIECAFEM